MKVHGCSCKCDCNRKIMSVYYDICIFCLLGEHEKYKKNKENEYWNMADKHLQLGDHAK